ncbi:MAG: hypothetical protein AB1345_04445 [Chloroflexota bacterium]
MDEKKPDAAASKPACTCMKDPLTDLPSDSPKPTQKTGGLRKVTCPGCGLDYWTNRKTDLCLACEKKGGG